MAEQCAQWQAIFFGASVKIADAVDRKLTLKKIVNERRLFTRAIYNFSVIRGIEYNQVERPDSLVDAVPVADIGIAHGFGLIFNDQLIRKFKHGIWNIHSGELPEFRGRHPIGWALLENKKNISVSIHSISTEIDRGILLAEEEINIDVDDDEKSLALRVQNISAGKLIDCAIENYLAGSYREIGEGRYLPSLQGMWDSVNPSEVDAVFLFNLIKSKRHYGGVNILGNRYTSCDIIFQELSELYSDGDVFTCSDGVQVSLK